MKRDQCNLSARTISLHDRRQLARFRADLGAMLRLVKDGHTRACAKLMVFGPESGLSGHCRCGFATAAP